MELSVKRRADRARMANEIEEIVEKWGAVSSRVTKDREIDVLITAARGLMVRVRLDGLSRLGDSFVLPWHIETGWSTRLSSRFPGSVNPYHRAKATVVAVSFGDLKLRLEHTLRMAQDGTAFEGEPMRQEMRGFGARGSL